MILRNFAVCTLYILMYSYMYVQFLFNTAILLSIYILADKDLLIILERDRLLTKIYSATCLQYIFTRTSSKRCFLWKSFPGGIFAPPT